MDFCTALKEEANYTRTENGALTHVSSLSHCVDFFATAGALREAEEGEIVSRFRLAFAEDRELAMKLLFFTRDIREGLGERRVFRTVFLWLARNYPACVNKNLPLVAEYGRWDDLLVLLDTPCREEALALIREQMERDMAALERGEPISLLAKWLPSANASSPRTAARGRRVARALGMTEPRYRRALTALRARLHILEDSLRRRDYTFDYQKQPSRAMHKYRMAFVRNDRERYVDFLARVRRGEAKMNTGTLYPYDIVARILKEPEGDLARVPQQEGMTEEERLALDTAWKALPDYTDGENALVVVDGSGSMYTGGQPSPISVALSLGIYYAQRNTGPFRNHFITFSQNPCMVEIHGRDIAEQVEYCSQFSEVANTDLARVFQLVLATAVSRGASREEMPARLYIISDMEFDNCVLGGDMTNFQYARELFERHGYDLPQVVFWNVDSRNMQQPVTANEQGAALVSGSSPRLFSMLAAGITSPKEFMLEVLNGPRYAAVTA